MSVASAFAATAKEPAARLIDFSGDAAVVQIDGRMTLVKRGMSVPGVGGTLRHVGGSRVLVEFPAHGTRGPVTVELMRGQAILVPNADDEPPAPLPMATVREIGMQASAVEPGRR